jgi:hypothetical protein
MDASKALSELLDKQAISEVLIRYCRGIDRCEPDLLRSVYWPEATDSHGVFDGNALEFADFILPFLRRFRTTSHCLSNIAIRLAGDRAAVESYVTAHHERTGDSGAEDYVVGGRYLDLFERRGEEWRILARRFVEDWNQVRPSMPRVEAEPVRRAFGARWPDDPSYSPLMTETA